MQFLFGSLLTYISSLGLWLTKKFGVKAAVITIQIALYSAFVVFMTTFVVFMIAYLMQLWLLFKTLISSYSDVSSVSGSYGGVLNSQIVSSSFAFLHDSGLADALITSGTLFISLLSFYFVIQLYKIIIFVKTIYFKLWSDLSQVLLA